MRFIKYLCLLLFVLSLTNCASGYKMISPKSINYISQNEEKDIKLEYKYDLLAKKYKKKEEKREIKVVAVKITNNSNNDYVFGKDLKLAYENGNVIYMMQNDELFKTLKQSTASYLFYLLLTPVNFYTSETNSNGFEEETSSFPIGLILGPGIAGGNMITAGSANKKFKQELLEYNILGSTIKSGETKFGIIGIRNNSYDSLELKIE